MISLCRCASERSGAATMIGRGGMSRRTGVGRDGTREGAGPPVAGAGSRARRHLRLAAPFSPLWREISPSPGVRRAGRPRAGPRRVGPRPRELGIPSDFAARASASASPSYPTRLLTRRGFAWFPPRRAPRRRSLPRAMPLASFSSLCARPARPRPCPCVAVNDWGGDRGRLRARGSPSSVDGLSGRQTKVPIRKA